MSQYECEMYVDMMREVRIEELAFPEDAVEWTEGEER